MRTCVIAAAVLICGCTSLDEGQIHTQGEAYFPTSWVSEPDFETDPGTELRLAYSNATAAFRDGKHADAVAGFSDAFRGASTTHDKVTGRIAESLVRMEQEEFDEAIVLLTEAIELSPNDWRPLFHRWQAYRALGDTAKAGMDRERGLTLNKALFRREFQYKRGVIWSGKGRPYAGCCF